MVSVVFWLLAAVSVGAALGVVLMRDIFRAALFLVVAFLAMAGFFVLLSAEFLAVVQVLVYAGAISVLIIFAVMLTQDVSKGNQANRLHVGALVAAGLVLTALVAAALQGGWSSLNPEVERVVQDQVVASGPALLGGLLVREFALPFVVAGALLLAALIGAIALVREE